MVFFCGAYIRARSKRPNECLCGKYKVFEAPWCYLRKSGVEVTLTIMRRERMGFTLMGKSSCAHLRSLKSLPSRIGLCWT